RAIPPGLRMIVIYNTPGIAITFAGCLVALVAMRFTPADVAGVPLLGFGVAWCVGDLVYRFKWGGGRLFHSLHGGHLYYVPMWVWGLICLYGGGMIVMGSIKSRQALPPPIVRPDRPATTRTTTQSRPAAA